MSKTQLYKWYVYIYRNDCRAVHWTYTIIGWIPNFVITKNNAKYKTKNKVFWTTRADFCFVTDLFLEMNFKVVITKNFLCFLFEVGVFASATSKKLPLPTKNKIWLQGYFRGDKYKIMKLYVLLASNFETIPLVSFRIRQHFQPKMRQGGVLFFWPCQDKFWF